jgi:hypothetical protein
MKLANKIGAVAAKAARRAADEIYYASLAVRAGLANPERPDRLARMGVAVLRSGMLGGLTTVAALRYRDGAAIIDEIGTVTFQELDERSTALANAWRARGLRDGEGVAILARNHRGFHYAVFAAAKCGARIILLNTDFAGPQLREVVGRESADLLVFDDEYSGILGDLTPPRGRYRAWVDKPAVDTLDNLIAGGSRTPPPPCHHYRPHRPADEWNNRHSQGRTAQRTHLARTSGRHPRQGALSGQGDHRMPCAAVSYARIRPRHRGGRVRVDAGDPPPLRSAGGARQPAPASRHCDDRGAGHVAAPRRCRPDSPCRT